MAGQEGVQGVTQDAAVIHRLVDETAELRRRLAAACKILAEEGQGDLIWGHMSARLPGADVYYMKPAQFGLEEIGPDDLLLLSRTGDVLWGRHSRHSEFPIHAEIYRARPDVNAVVHTHPPAAVAFSASDRRLLPVSHEGVLFTDLPLFTLTTDLIVTREQGQALAAALGSARAVLLRNHGIVTVGATVAAACMHAIFLAKACQVQLMAHALADSPHHTPPEEAGEKLQRIYRPEALEAAFAYLARRHRVDVG